VFEKLIPRDHLFFEIFDQICAKIVEGVDILKRMLETGSRYNEFALQLKTVEHESDQLVHQLMAHLHKTFITPIDREDIHHLAVRLDDILDMAESAASRIDLYQPRTIPRELLELTNVLLQSARLVQQMIGCLHDMKKSAQTLALSVEINRLEDLADHIRRSTIARLFREEKDPFELVKWKEIVEFVERSTDRCEDVADIAEGIVLENT